MSVTEQGTVECDKCGSDCGNGSVIQSVVVSDVDLDSGTPINYHFCRANDCAKKVLNATHLRHYKEKNNGSS